MHAHIHTRINSLQNGEVPPGYRKTKVGVIPSEWKLYKLGFFVKELKSGLSRRLSNSDIGLPVIRSNNLQNNKVDFNDIKYWYTNDPQGAKTFNYFLLDGDILINFINSLSQIGKTALFKNEIGRDIIFTTNILKMTLNSGLLPLYFLFYSQTSKYNNYIYSITKPAVNQASFTTVDFKNMLLPLPPLPEQQKIADILSAWDEAIGLQQELIAQKQTQKRGLMQLLLTGKKRLNGFNDDWVVTKLGNVAHITMGQSPDSKDYNNNGEGKYLIQGNADIKNRKSSPRIWTKTITKECDVDDILMTVRAPVGAIAKSLHHACIGRGVCSIKAKKIEHNFLFQLLLSFEKRWISFEQGSTFTAVNGKDIKNLKIRIPCQKVEQQQIADILATADKEIELLHAELERLRTQKKGLMQLLLSGRIRVNECLKQESLMTCNDTRTG